MENEISKITLVCTLLIIFIMGLFTAIIVDQLDKQSEKLKTLLDCPTYEYNMDIVNQDSVIMYVDDIQEKIHIDSIQSFLRKDNQ